MYVPKYRTPELQEYFKRIELYTQLIVLHYAHDIYYDGELSIINKIYSYRIKCNIIMV